MRGKVGDFYAEAGGRNAEINWETTSANKK